MRFNHVFLFAIFFALLAPTVYGTGGKEFVATPDIAQGYLVWPKDTRPNVTYMVRVEEKNLAGQIIKVKNFPSQSDNFFHVKPEWRTKNKPLTVKVRSYVGNTLDHQFTPVDVLPFEAPDNPSSTLVCSWDCPGSGWTIEAYEIASNGGGVHYILELLQASPSYYYYIPYAAYENSNLPPMTTPYVIDMGNVDVSDGYCNQGVALSGHIVGVMIQNPYGILQSNPLWTSPCIYSEANHASLLLEQNCANCDPGLDIECNVSGDCVDYGPFDPEEEEELHDWIDDLFHDWLDELLDSQLDFATNLESTGAIEELFDYDRTTYTLTAFQSVEFNKHKLDDAVKMVSLYRMDDDAPIAKYNVKTLDAQNPGKMKFSLDMSQKPAGLYYMYVLLEDGHYLMRVFHHDPSGSPKKTGEFVASEIGLAVYPNPVGSQMTARIEGGQGMAQLNIVDLSGKLRMSESVDVVGVQQDVEIDVDQLAAGVYFLQMEVNGQRKVQKFIVQ